MVKEEHKKVKLGPKKITVPSGWKIKDMKDLIKFKNGYAFSSKNYSENGKIVFRMSNINRKGNLNVNEENIKYCSEETYDELERYHLAKDDLVICMTDMNSDLNILGRTGIIDKDDEYILNQRVGRMRVKNEDIVNFKYLHYFTNFKPYLDYIKATATGTAQYNTSTKTIKNTNVVLPSLPEQKKIASILSSVDKSIEKTDEVIEETKELKKGLMQELLTRGIGHSEFKEVELGPNIIEIPASWNFRQIDDISTKVVDGVHSTPDYTESGIPFITTTNLTSGKIDFSECKYISEKAHKKLIKRANPERGDILFTKVGTLGITDVVDFDKEFSIFVQLALIKLKEKYDPFYYKYLLNSALIRGRVKSISAGSTLKYIGVGQIKNLFILVPPLEEQKKIASILSSVDTKIKKEEEYKAKLERLKKGLMQKLLTGEIRVNTDMEV